MNKKGFTLIELIASILILSTLIVIGISSYTSISNSVKNAAVNDQINKIKTAAENYAADTNQRTFFIQDLIMNGYLDSGDNNNYPNPKDGSSMNCYPIKVSMVKGSYEATIKEEAGACDESRLTALNDGVNITASLVSGTTYRLKIICPKSQKIIVASNLGHPVQIKDSCPAAGNYTIDVTVTQKPITFTATYRPTEAESKNTIVSSSVTIE